MLLRFIAITCAGKLIAWSIVILVIITIKAFNMITISNSAQTYIHQMMEKEGHATGSFVRVGVKGGGCSGLSYEMKFDTEMKESDQVFEDKGVKLVVEMKSLLYLYGTELDYSSGLNGKGLFFNNPNAARTCACGESFAL
jgi:iron-sulfur cluster assembly protein